jgi:tRNA threonylcarbamoyladenosine modification (KEOPS) complex  Pcc1 subunit
MISAEIRVRNVNGQLLHEALAPELKNEFARSDINVSRIEDGILLGFTAKDVTALRATLNSYLRWLTVITEIDEELDRNATSRAKNV